MDLPVGPDYVLGPGDGLNIDVWGGISQRFSRSVDREGRLALPEAGPVVVAGLTLSQAQKLVQDALAPQFRDAKVDISVARLRTVRVYVVGDVQRPGPYDVSSLSTALNALYSAGGPTAVGSLRTLRHLRGTQLIRELDLYEFFLHGVRSEGDLLQPGDTILVPPAGAQVAITGMVRRPAIYELKGERNLSEIVDIAGGVLVTAALGNITVERILAHNQRVLLSVTASDKAAEGEKKALESFQVEDGDKITIPPILPYKESTVYLQGHVARPGKYSYREGLTINDVLRSYQDVLPEPSKHAEIVRLEAPDYRPETIEFNLDDVLSGDDPIALKPFDTIRIFGRYDVDPPMVYMYGEVLRPGQYPLAQGMTAGALVHMAGGLKRSAYRETADVASYKVDNGNKVETEHHTFSLLKALDGDTATDIMLKPGDVVTVRQLPGWKDIGASVTLNGEVVYPGTYGIQEGERLSSVLKRAGGFRPTAYSTAALFERVEVKQLAEKSRDEVIRRIEASGINAKAALNSSGQDQAAMLNAMMQQQQQVLSRLRNQSVVGRMVININGDITSWENTTSDIELRAGDVLTIPKRPQFVLVSGQVYNSSAQAYVPGKTAGWYLSRAGGATEMANKKSVYIVRANGSVVSKSSGKWFKGDVLSTKMKPGDVLVVPEKIVGGSVVWKNVLTTAQFLSSMAFAAAALNNL
ncbi:MAG: SLBB domain-containing protein [Acidobacteriaceae bacterium]